jgi:hypothetical protein
MWWLPQTSGTHIWEPRWFESIYTLQEKTWPTCHTLLTLSPHMALDHTYLTWSTYSNISWSHQQQWTEPLLPIQSTARRLTDLLVCTQFLSRTNHWSSGGKATICWRQTIRFTGPIYQHVIGTFNTCSRGSTHRSLTNTSGSYNLRGVIFTHTTPWPSQPSISTFHLRAPPGL